MFPLDLRLNLIPPGFSGMSQITKSACAYRALSTSSSSNSIPPIFSQNAANKSSPYEAHIELDERIYNPGDLVSGQILLDLERPLACDQIVVRLHGSARVFFTEILKTPGPMFGKTRAYEQERILVDQQVEVWASDQKDEFEMNENGKVKKSAGKSLEEIVRQCNPNAIRMGPRKTENSSISKNCPKGVDQNHHQSEGLGIGRHEFHFSFKLPLSGLFTSFDARNSAGSVRYHIMLQAFHNGFNCFRRKLLFPIVCPKRLDEPALLEEAMRPIVENGSDKKDLLKVQLLLDKCGYVPGEPLRGHVKIQNNSGRSVKHMSLRIQQRTTCYASRPEFATHQSQFETSSMGLPVAKIQTGQSMDIPIRYYVPALVPEIYVPGCIESEHMLCLTITNKNGTSVELRTPLLIGTHPTPLSTSAHQPNPEDFDANSDVKVVAPPPSQFDAPPPYTSSQNGQEAGVQENSQEVPMLAPPSYAQSVAGIGGQVDQEETGQYGGPICYHYDFGFNPEDEGRGGLKMFKRRIKPAKTVGVEAMLR